MKAKVGMLVLVASVMTVACSQQRENNAQVLSQDKNQIIGGELVTVADEVAKTTVGLYMETESGTGICSGTLLSEDVVLTAAHCVDGDLKQLLVVFHPNFVQLSRANVRPAVTFVQHALWKTGDEEGGVGQRDRGDMALVKFAGGIPEGYKPAKLIADETEFKVDDKVMIVGYGLSDAVAKTGDGVLRKAEVKILGALNNSEIVTDESEGKGVCFGDSGGPAYFKENGEWVLWGVASAVSKETCNEVAIHTAVQAYSEWIKKGVKALHDLKDSDLAAPAATPVPTPAPATSTTFGFGWF